MLFANWADAFEALAAAAPAETVIVQGRRRCSWSELDERASRLASALTDAGVGRDDRVALMLHDCPEYLEAVLGALKVRAVPINVNTRYRSEEIRYLLKDSGAGAFVYADRFHDEIADVGDDLPATCLVVGGPSAPRRAASLPYGAVVAAAEAAEPVVRDGEDWFMLYTGGTTGMPKGVVWRHGDLLEVMWRSGRISGAEEPATLDDVVEAAEVVRSSGAAPVLLSIPPLMHGMGVFQAMSTLLRGGRVVLLEDGFDAEEVCDLVERERVTDMTIVGDAFARPILDELIRRESAGNPADWSSLAAVMSSGAGWGRSTKQGLLERTSAALENVLGATEGGPFASEVVANVAELTDEPQFRLTPDTVLLDEDDSLLPPGADRPGRIAFGGVCSSGYFQDDAKTASVFRTVGGRRYLVLGDYAMETPSGTVRFIGRGSACINTGGEKVFADEVEEILKTHPAVVDCVVLGVPDERYGEAVTAVIEVDHDVELDVEAVTEFLEGRLAGFKKPRHLVRVDRVPRTTTGKCDLSATRRVALERLGIEAAHDPAEPSPVGTKE